MTESPPLAAATQADPAVEQKPKKKKQDSFVGSDFSYGDISLPKVDQYHHTMLRNEKVDGFDCYVIQSVPANFSTPVSR